MLSFVVLALQLFENRKDNKRYCFTQLVKFTINLPTRTSLLHSIKKLL